MRAVSQEVMNITIPEGDVLLVSLGSLVLSD